MDYQRFSEELQKRIIIDNRVIPVTFMQILGHNPFEAGFFSGADIQVI